MINCTFKKTDTGFVVYNDKKSLEIIPDGMGVKIGRSYYIFAEYRKIVDSVVLNLADDIQPYWKAAASKKKVNLEKYKSPNPKFSKWYYNRCERAISKDFASHWHWLIANKVDPKFRALSKRYASIVGCTRSYGCILNKEIVGLLMNDEYLYNDFMKFPACVYAAIYTSKGGTYSFFNHISSTKKETRIETFKKNWMYLYSKKHELNGPLKKTISNMPRGLPENIVEEIADTNVKSTMIGKAKIIMSIYEKRANDQNIDIINKSSNDEILRVARMARRRDLPFNMRKTSAIIDFKRYLMDYPNRYHGDLKGLFLRSYRWHSDPRNIKSNHSYPDTACFPIPPWGNIDTKEGSIKYIPTVGDLKIEGVRMRHCVAGYTPYCMSGKSFIYRVDFKKDSATMEVGSNGVVRQIQGPANKKNDACSWGARTFLRHLKKSKWKIPSKVEEKHRLEAVPF